MLAFSAFMIVSSYQLMVDASNINIPILDIPRSYVYASMVFTFVGTTIVLVYQIISFIKTRDMGDETDDLGDDI